MGGEIDKVDNWMASLQRISEINLLSLIKATK